MLKKVFNSPNENEVGWRLNCFHPYRCSLNAGESILHFCIICRAIRVSENCGLNDTNLVEKLQAAKSSEFHAAFRANADVKVIEVPEMTLEELKAFVSFFYTGTISPNIMTEFMTTFLRAADKYKMQYLAAVCEDALVSNLSRENAITTFDIAKKQCSNAAKESVLKKLLKMGEISTYEEYKVYTQKDPGLLLELYEQLSERIGPLLAKRRRITTGDYLLHPNLVT